MERRSSGGCCHGKSKRGEGRKPRKGRESPLEKVSSFITRKGSHLSLLPRRKPGLENKRSRRKVRSRLQSTRNLLASRAEKKEK